MSWWEILNVDKNSDIKEIKKAYAKLLKDNHPEDNPEGYQRLRQAYDIAIKVKKSKARDIQVDEPDNEENEKITPHVDIKLEQIQKNNDKIYEFIKRLNEIYNDIYERVNLENWKELFNMEVSWNIQTYSYIESKIFYFVSENKYLPTEVWTLIETNYKWSQRELELYRKFDDFRVKEVQKIINNPCKVSANLITNIDLNSLKQYLSFRAEAYDNMIKNNYSKASELISEASEIYDKDPELIGLYANILMKKKKLDEAMNYYKLALEIDKSYLKYEVEIGYILVQNKQYDESIIYFQSYLNNSNRDDKMNHKRALYYLGYAYYYKKNYERAEYYINEASEIEEFHDFRDTLIQQYLKNLRDKRQGKIVRKIKEEDIYLQKANKSHKKRGEFYRNRAALTVVIFICIIMLRSLGDIFNHDNSFIDRLNNTTQTNINNLYEIQNNETGHKVGTFAALLSGKEYETYSVDLYDIKELDSYAVLNEDGTIQLCSQDYINQNNLSDKVYSKVYLGYTLGSYILFADKNFTMASVNDVGNYTVVGSKENLPNNGQISITLKDGKTVDIKCYLLKVS